MHQIRVPQIRIRQVNHQPLNSSGRYVLYWMIAARRTGWNFALQRAVEQSLELNRPLVILETLSCDYPYASDRLHRFILDGMADNCKALTGKPVRYYPFISRGKEDDRGLLAAFAKSSCLVVTDDAPAFITPKLIEAAAKILSVPVEAVDGNGLLPMRLAEKVYPTAYAFRRFLQKHLPLFLCTPPRPDPLAGAELLAPPTLDPHIIERWPEADCATLNAPSTLARLPIDHNVQTISLTGGADAAHCRMGDFIRNKLVRYAALRNHPDQEATSGLSPYLHFGHISTHIIFTAISDWEGWTPDRLGHKSAGQRAGWWGMSENAEAFLDQLVTWRELGFNRCVFEAHDAGYQSLPEWARNTLQSHTIDPRPYLYSLPQFASGQTHDPLWNAAQNQLRTEGMIHNYLRMLWGKKILEWSPTPQAALQTMVELNDRYALDGRDPNSYSGILWCLGRYDRPWGPARPIFGSVRYMSSENTRRKLRLTNYLQRYE
ncbi:MAG: deoxyribodipyrimidine photolyase [Desulfuromonas sp.]|nr:MAG: deoxyribodipyrimidine photolyase [Desulfuromonas sp.]